MSEVTLSQLMAATPESLAKMQYEALQVHVLQVLSKIEGFILGGDYESVVAGTFVSLSGDGYGMDNTCINFTFFEGDEESNVMDIGEVCERLKELHKIAYGSKF